MAQLEFRNATVRIMDGFSATAAVNNNPSGYSAGAATMIIDAASATIPVLASFYVAGDPIRHIVTSTNGSTTITFSPVLSENVLDDAVITFGGRALEVKIGEGNLTYNEQRTMEYVLDRGNLDNVREGDDVPMDVSLDFVWEFLNAVAASGTPTIEDAFKQRGEASSWVSSDSDQCRPYAVDIEIEHVPPCGGEEPETVLLPDFRWESFNHDLRAATVAVGGKCNSKEAVIARHATS